MDMNLLISVTTFASFCIGFLLLLSRKFEAALGFFSVGAILGFIYIVLA